MTLEPPKGVKSNLFRSYTRINDKYMNECDKPKEFKKLLYAICLFHACIQDRRKFGPLGWNIPYDFTDGDLMMCQRQIKMLLNEYDEIPFKVIRVLCGEINYGGRVTDDKDRRLMASLLEIFIVAGVVAEDYSYSQSGTYISPACDTVEEFLELVKNLPLVPLPEIHGLHANADITCDQNETYAVFETVLSLQPRVSSGGGLKREEVIEEAAKDIRDRCPKMFDIDQVLVKYPTKYEECLNTVLSQECIRYNGLLSVMAKTIFESIKALKGLVVMSPELEGVCDAIFNNQVPGMWEDKAYPSMKPLSAWFGDLLERVDFINGWIENGAPPVFWFSGFFFPQAFLTGAQQNYARKQGFAIDTVGWDFHIEDSMDKDKVTAPPENGVYIWGLYLEGARWDDEEHVIGESRPKELFTEFPMMWLSPKQHRVAPTEGIYDCPCYKILSRMGVLSTTGHSTNFVMFFEIPSKHEQTHWINRGVALFTSLQF
jgi:dynein heavy chain